MYKNLWLHALTKSSIESNSASCLDDKSHRCTLDRLIKTFFLNFQKSRAVLCYILIDRQMLEKVFCSNIAPSLSSENHLFYIAEYMGRSCPPEVQDQHETCSTICWSPLETPKWVKDSNKSGAVGGIIWAPFPESLTHLRLRRQKCI